MLAGQKLVAEDGKEVALFPFPYLVMSQDEGGDTSHIGTYNMDFLGWGPFGRVFTAPVYAPVTMKVVDFWNTYDGGHQVTFESVDEVHLADGTIDYLTISIAHAVSPPYTQIGQIVEQGEICYYSGAYGYVTGDHIHSCCGKGRYIGFVTRPSGWMDLANRIHYWDAVYTNDTIIIQGFGHDWHDFTGGITPTGIKKHKFPWSVYFNRFRNNRINV